MIQTTQTGLSIGTGLALESINSTSVYDSERPIPTSIVKLTELNAFYVNIKTLVRNVIHSVSASEVHMLRPDDIIDFCRGEMQIIPTLTAIYPPIRVQYYVGGLGHIMDIPSIARTVRVPKTEKQMFVDLLVKRSVQTIASYDRDILQPRYLLNSSKDKALILTHVVLDLYAYTRFASLTLLESNTGKMKPATQFASKYYNIPPDVVKYIPFSFKSGLLLGDYSIFKPAPVKVKQQFIQACIDNKWNASTPDTKVLTGLNRSEYEIAHMYYKDIPNNI